MQSCSTEIVNNLPARTTKIFTQRPLQAGEGTPPLPGQDSLGVEGKRLPLHRRHGSRQGRCDPRSSGPTLGRAENGWDVWTCAHALVLLAGRASGSPSRRRPSSTQSPTLPVRRWATPSSPTPTRVLLHPTGPLSVDRNTSRSTSDRCARHALPRPNPFSVKVQGVLYHFWYLDSFLRWSEGQGCGARPHGTAV